MRVTLNDDLARGRCGAIGGATAPTSHPTGARPEARRDDDAKTNTGTLRGSRDVDPHRNDAAQARVIVARVERRFERDHNVWPF
jgi:hypothetical protein